jgi:glycosyltransferase involved in cell wall biosynthesis
VKVILVTNNTLEDKAGGLERYVCDLASALARRCAEVTIVAKRRLPESPRVQIASDGVRIERYTVPSKANPLFALLYPFYVAMGIRRRTRALSPPPVVHVHMGLLALPLALAQEPYLLTFHSPVWRELLSERQGSYALPGPMQSAAVAALRGVEASTAARARETVVLSEFMRSELAILNPAAAERASLLAGGVDTDRFTTDTATPDRRDEGAPMLFTARRLSPRTGVDELIRAMPAILRAHPGCRLMIAGAGLMEAELRRLAGELDVAAQVEFLGRVSDEELVDCYRRATLVVVPTRELEGFGLTTAEALACGAAVVGTPAGATGELLGPLHPGLLTEDTSARAIAATVSRWLSDRPALAQVRARAPARVAEMGWDAVATRHTELYERHVQMALVR